MSSKKTKKKDIVDDALLNELYRPPSNELISSSLIDSFVGKYEGPRDKETNLFSGHGFLEIPGHYRYKGEFKNSYIHGKGSIVFENGTRYEGEFEYNDLTSKNGHFIYPDGGEYFGSVVRGYRHGKGKYVFGNKVFEGMWRVDKRNGFGKMIFNEQGSCFYEGNFVENNREGYGKMVYENEDFYEGFWKDNKKNGEGKMSWKDLGEKYSGNWVDGKPEGFGNYSYINFGEQVMNYYCGNFISNERNGFGIFYYSDGSKYSGFFKNDKKHGKGVFEHVNGICEELSFDKDTLIRNGKKSLFTVGRLKSVPLFINDIFFELKGNIKKNEIWDIQRVVSRNIPKLHILNKRFCLYKVKQEVFFDKLIRCSKKNEMSKIQLYKFLLCCGLIISPPQGGGEGYNDNEEEGEEEEKEEEEKEENELSENGKWKKNIISLAEINRIILRTLDQQEFEKLEIIREEKKNQGEEVEEIIEDSSICKKRQNVFDKTYEIKIPNLKSYEEEEDIHDLSKHPIQFRSFVEVLGRIGIFIFMETPCLSKKVKHMNNDEEGIIYKAIKRCFEDIIIPRTSEKFENDEEELERNLFLSKDEKYEKTMEEYGDFLRSVFEYFSTFRDFHADIKKITKFDCVLKYRQFLKVFKVLESEECFEYVKKFLFEGLEEEEGEGEEEEEEEQEDKKNHNFDLLKEKLDYELIFEEFVSLLFNIYENRKENIDEVCERLMKKFEAL